MLPKALYQKEKERKGERMKEESKKKKKKERGGRKEKERKKKEKAFWLHFKHFKRSNSRVRQPPDTRPTNLASYPTNKKKKPQQLITRCFGNKQNPQDVRDLSLSHKISPEIILL